MHCIKCGRSISGGVFCAACSAPPMPAAAVQLPTKTAGPVKKAAPAKKKKGRSHYVKLCRSLTAVVAALSVLLLLLSAALFLGARAYVKRQQDLRVREASITLREKEADKQDERIAQLEKDLAKTLLELEKYR